MKIEKTEKKNCERTWKKREKRVYLKLDQQNILNFEG
jgi:hypothetical protein